MVSSQPITIRQDLPDKVHGVKLSSQQVDQFWKDGALTLKNLLNEREVDALNKRAEWVATGAAPHICSSHLQVEPKVAQNQTTADSYANSLRKMSHLASADEVFRDHARNPKILDVIESLIGADIKLYTDQLFMKPPKIGSRQPCHQDIPCGFHIDPPVMVTCWTAINDSTVENGCLWMVRGSHRHGRMQKSQWAEFEQKSVEGRLTEEQPVIMKAGGCSFHHGLTLHSSRPNQSSQPRRGYATHYVSARCRYTGTADRNHAILVRGRSWEGCI